MGKPRADTARSKTALLQTTRAYSSMHPAILLEALLSQRGKVITEGLCVPTSTIIRTSPKVRPAIVREPPLYRPHDIHRLRTVHGETAATRTKAKEHLARVASEHVIRKVCEVCLGNIWIVPRLHEAVVVLRQQVVHTRRNRLDQIVVRVALVHITIHRRMRHCLVRWHLALKV